MARRVGVFDSGIGGLTVLRQLRAVFPRTDMIYLGDLARVPYGGRSVETITRYARDDVRFLRRFQVDAVIVACGTVSSTALETLQREFDVPIYGVIRSAAARAAEITRTGSVGVIGTQATVRSGAYPRLIRSIDPAVNVTVQACPLFVPLVENGIAPDDPVAETIARRYLSAFDGKNIDALIMGCTHYPVYRSTLEKVLPGVEMIDVGEALASSLKKEFGPGEGTGEVAWYVTERSAAFDEVVRIMDPEIDPARICVDDRFVIS